MRAWKKAQLPYPLSQGSARAVGKSCCILSALCCQLGHRGGPGAYNHVAQEPEPG